jgi:hypothetical protein
MSIAHRLLRSFSMCALVCAALMTAAAGTATAAPSPDPYAQERYYASLGNADTSAAIAQEQYLGSYGEPQPLSPPQSSLPSDETPWLPIALAIAGTLVVVAASATQLRRLRLRRRRAAGSSA